MSKLSLWLLPTWFEMQLCAVSMCTKPKICLIWYWVSPRFELPVSNQQPTSSNSTAHTSYQPAVPKSAQPRRPLDQVTCFKVVHIIINSQSDMIVSNSVGRKGITLIW